MLIPIISMNENNTKEDSLEISDTIHPLDWGILFVRSRLKDIFKVSILPLLLYMIVGYLTLQSQMAQSFDLQSIFIYAVMDVLASVWLISILVFFIIKTLSNSPYTFREISLRSIITLPKVILSYFCVFIILLFSFLALQSAIVSAGIVGLILVIVFIPLLSITFSLIWSPLFVAGESFALNKKSKDDDEESSFFDDLEDEDAFIEKIEQRAKESFKDKALFELGFSRSAKLAKTNSTMTYWMLLIYAFGSIAPLALAQLLLGNGAYSGGELFSLGVQKIVMIYVYAIFVAVFFAMVGPTARKEVGIHRYVSLEDLYGNKQVPKFRIAKNKKNKYLFLILTFVSFLILLSTSFGNNKYSSSAKFEMNELIVGNTEIIMSFTLQDSQELLRWLQPINFRLQLENSFESSDEDQDSTMILQPRKIDALNSSGQALHPYFFLNIRTALPLKLRLTFEKPKNMSEQAYYYLYYPSEDGLGQALVSGQLGTEF